LVLKEHSPTLGSDDLPDEALFWTMAVPAAALVLAIGLTVVLLVVPSTVAVERERFLARTQCLCKPEPREEIGYVTAIVLPIAALWLVRIWRPRRIYRRFRRRWQVGLMRWIFAGVILGVLFYQEFRVEPYFGGGWLLATLAISIVLAIMPAPIAWTDWFPWLLQARWLRKAATPAALLTTAIFLLPTLYRATQPDIPKAYGSHAAIQMGEFAAAVEGRTALVDFFPQYQNLLPYLFVPAFHVVRLSIGSFSVAMAVLSFLALASIYRVFSVLTNSSASAFAFYLPFLSVSMMPLIDAGKFADVDASLHQQLNTFNYYAVGPLRYFGPYLLAGILGWCLCQPTWRRAFVLFFIAGFVAINNLDFGLPALAAALVAVLLAGEQHPWPSRRTLFRAVTAAAPAIALSVMTFAFFTRFRSGSWPHWWMATLFQRAFAVNGFGMLPMPICGLHWVIYLTFIAAISRGLFDRHVTPLHRGMLLYSGIFGLGALMYFVGRSHHGVLITIFSAWAFAFSILIMNANLDKRFGFAARRPLPAALRLLAILGLLSCLAQVRHAACPWNQVHRLQVTGGNLWNQPAAMINFIRAQSRPGERMIIACPYGHLIALEAGVTNVFPFSEAFSLILRSQLDQVLAAMDQAHVDRVVGWFDPEFKTALNARGFVAETDSPGYSVWIRPSLVSRSHAAR
jgi:hypothetical protein